VKNKSVTSSSENYQKAFKSYTANKNYAN